MTEELSSLEIAGASNWKSIRFGIKKLKIFNPSIFFFFHLQKKYILGNKTKYWGQKKKWFSRLEGGTQKRKLVCKTSVIDGLLIFPATICRPEQRVKAVTLIKIRAQAYK